MPGHVSGILSIFGGNDLTLVETSQVGSLAARVGESTHVPVDAGLPSSIVHAVEEVEEHGCDELLLTISPVNGVESTVLGGFLDFATSHLILLPGISTSPDGKGQDEESSERDLGANTSSNVASVKGIAKDESADNLREPVEKIVESTSSSVEVGTVHVVGLVGVEDVGREEHGEEEENPGRSVESFPKTLDLGAPGRVLHQDDLGVVLTNNLVGIDKEESHDGTEQHEDDEGSIGAIGDVSGSLVDVLTKGNLFGLVLSIQ